MHAATPFNTDRPIPVQYYANELNRYVQGIVPNASKEQIKTIEGIATNVKLSHAQSQQDLMSRINEFKEKMEQRERENAELKAELNRLDKKFEHMEIEKNLYEFSLVTNDEYENYISNLKDQFKEKIEGVKIERDDFKRQCSDSSEKMKKLENHVSHLEETVKNLGKQLKHHELASVHTPGNIKHDCREGNTEFLAKDDVKKREDLEDPEKQKLRAENANLQRINRCAEKKIDMLNETIEAMKKKIGRKH